MNFSPKMDLDPFPPPRVGNSTDLIYRFRYPTQLRVVSTFFTISHLISLEALCIDVIMLQVISYYYIRYLIHSGGFAAVDLTFLIICRGPFTCDHVPTTFDRIYIDLIPNPVVKFAVCGFKVANFSKHYCGRGGLGPGRLGVWRKGGLRSFGDHHRWLRI